MANKKENKMNQIVEELNDIKFKIKDGEKAREKYIEQNREYLEAESKVVVEHFLTANGTKMILDTYRSFDKNPDVNLSDALNMQKDIHDNLLRPYLDKLPDIKLEEANEYFDDWISADFVKEMEGKTGITLLVRELVVSRLASILHDKWIELIEYDAKTKAGLDAMQQELESKQKELKEFY